MLIATDFSPTSYAAAMLAASLARPSDGDILLLHVERTGAPASLPGQGPDRPQSALQEVQRAFDDRGLPTLILLRPGDPAREILAVANARAPQIIVMGTHGHSRWTTPLLGSVADRVARYSPYPILMVPRAERRSSTPTGSSAV